MLNKSFVICEMYFATQVSNLKVYEWYDTLRKLAHAINRICFSLKNENFQQKNIDIFLIIAQNIDCVYTLVPPRRGGSNEYPQSMFWSKNKKNRYTHSYPSFAI